MREAYLLLREREKAGVEPISKVLMFSTIGSLLNLYPRISSTLRSCWPICPLMRSWRRRELWSTSKWLVNLQTDLRGSTEESWLFIAGQHFEWFQDVKSARDIHPDSQQWRLWFFRYIDVTPSVQERGPKTEGRNIGGGGAWVQAQMPVNTSSRQIWWIVLEWWVALNKRAIPGAMHQDRTFWRFVEYSLTVCMF